MDLEYHSTFPDGLESSWNHLLDLNSMHVPFLRYEYQRIWWQTRGGGEWETDVQLAIVTAREGSELIGIAPIFFAPNFEGKPTLLLLGSFEISDYLDLIAPKERLDDFIQALLPFLHSSAFPAWQSFHLHNLFDTSPTLLVLKDVAEKLGWEFSTHRLQHSPYILLPDTFEAYLAGIDKKQRHEIRRKMRRADENSLAVRYYTVQDKFTLDREIDDFLALMAQEEGKWHFLTPLMREHMRLTIHCAFERDCLHLAFLEIGGEKAAGQLCFDYLNRIWAYNSGINRKFSELSPGWVLLVNELQWAIENKRLEYDFMRGDEEYKYRFGAVNRLVVKAVLTP